MIEQYKFMSKMNTQEYANIEKAPLLFTAQASLELANFVGDFLTTASIPSVQKDVKQLEMGIEKSSAIGSYLSEKEQNFLDSLKKYIEAIKNLDQDIKLNYEDLLDKLHTMCGITTSNI